MKALDWLLLALVVVAVAVAIRSVIRQRKRGCSGCSGVCSHCERKTEPPAQHREQRQ